MMGHAIGYQYAHDFPGHYVVQQYLPDAIKDREYYRFGDNKTEQAALAYRQKSPVDGPVEEEPMQHKMRENPLAPKGRTGCWRGLW